MQQWTRQMNWPLALGVGLSFVWLIQIVLGKMPVVDQLTRRFVERLQETSLHAFFRFMTEFGSGSFLVPFTIGLAVIFLFLYRHVWPAFLFAGGTLSTHFLNQLIKHIVQRDRPSILAEANALGYSFPSGHAMIPVVCYGLAFYFISKKWPHQPALRFLKIATILLVLLIGISRYVINVHYLTDVLVGFGIGWMLLRGFIYVDKRMEKKKRRPANR